MIPCTFRPVGAAPVWNPTLASDGHTVEEYRAWTAMNSAVELAEVRPQEGDDQASFRRVLGLVAECCVVEAELQVLLQSMRSRRTVEDAASFEDDAHLFLTNSQADNWDWVRHPASRHPHRAHQSQRGFNSVPPDRFRGLALHLFLAVGSRIFINNNIRTSAGLANGAVAEVLHIPWPNERAPPLQPHVCVQVDLPR